MLLNMMRSGCSDVLFRYFTNAEYAKAKECLHNNKQYEIHLVLEKGG